MGIVALLLTIMLLPCPGWSQVVDPSPSATATDLTDIAHLPAVPTKLRVVTIEDKPTEGKTASPSSENQKQQQITAGDLVELTIELPDQFQGAEPSMAAALATQPVAWGEGRILWYKKINSKNLTLGLTTYKPGRFQIAPIPLQISGLNVAATEPKEIEFAALVKDDKDNQGEKKEKELYPPQKTNLPLKIIIAVCFLSLLALTAIIYGIYKWRQRRRPGLNLKQVKPALPPLEEFEAAVRALDLAGYFDQAKYKPYYFGISDAAKKFLGRIFHFDAEDRTSRELGQELVRYISNDFIVNEWCDLFEELDIVKFTDQAPSDAQARALSSRMLQLARRTNLTSPDAQAKGAP